MAELSTLRTTLRATLAATGHLPVAVLDSADDAVSVAGELVAGGLPLIEITLRTPASLDAIRAVAAAVPGICLGAGTVLTAEQVDTAVAAGAAFIVSPGLSPAVLRRAEERGVPAVPGVSTASEVQRALELGHDLLKFFPAAAAGGPMLLKAFAAPFPSAMFIPTGGITPDTAADYLDLPNVTAVGGSWFVDRRAVSEGRVDGVTTAVREALRRHS